MGNHRLAEVFDWAVSRRRIDLMISFGFGGGLTPTLQVGDVCLCDRFCRWDGGSRSIEPGGFTTPLGFWTESLGDRLSWTHCIDVTTAGLAPKRELARGLTPLILRSQALVDMESFTLARLAREASIPFLTLRSISDTLDQEIDFDLSLISDDQGSLETRRIALAVLHRPGLALTMAGLWHHSRRAAATLGRAVASLVDLPYRELQAITENGPAKEWDVPADMGREADFEGDGLRQAPEDQAPSEGSGAGG